MVQWSTGTQAQDWTAQMKRIAGAPLLEPVVRVKEEETAKVPQKRPDKNQTDL